MFYTGGSYIGGMPVSSVSTYPQQQAGAPYTGSPAYTAGQQVPTVGVKGNPANSGGYSSDYTSRWVDFVCVCVRNMHMCCVCV